MEVPSHSPAEQSYRQQQKFHRNTLTSHLRGFFAKALSRELRQQLRLRRRLELLRDFTLDSIDLALGRRKELIPPRYLNFVGHGDFEAIGDEFLRYFVELGALKDNSSVLEVGCGIGRMARPLTTYLKAGSYDGIDIVPKGIRWCERNVTSRFPNFKFHLADVHNLAYNPTGRLRALEYTFPFPDGHFDFIALTSVFSHLLSAEMEHYLHEAARCLRTNGKALITFFLLNEESCRLIETGASALTFQFSRDGCSVNDDIVPEYAVAYQEGEVLQRCAEVGFVIDSLRYGLWCGRPEYLSYQDIVIVRKAG